MRSNHENSVDIKRPERGSRKALNIVMVALFASIIFCVLISQGLSYLGVAFPSWTGIGEERSYLEGRSYEENPELSIESLGSGEFQESAEQYVSDRVPSRDNILLTNASVQRSSIKLASDILGFDTYPTYYGSSKAYSENEKAIASIPQARSFEAYRKGLSDFAEGLDMVAKANPDKTFIVYLADISGFSQANLLNTYVRPYFTTMQAYEILEDDLVGTENVVVMTNAQTDPSEYAKRYYKGDHHWNSFGMREAMNQIASSLGHDDFVSGGTVVVEGPSYVGAQSRDALLEIEEDPEDSSWTLDGITNELDGVSRIFSEHDSYHVLDDAAKRYSFYGNYFPNSDSLNGNGEGNALLVYDSFGTALQGPLASIFDMVYMKNALHNSAKGSDKLIDQIKEKDADTVLFVGSTLNYATFCQRNPSYFVGANGSFEEG